MALALEAADGEWEIPLSTLDALPAAKGTNPVPCNSVGREVSV
jgi:hypothetical protein